MLLIDLIALALAWASASVLALVIALLATLITAGLWISEASPLTGSVAGMLTVVGGFGIFFSTRRDSVDAADRRRATPMRGATCLCSPPGCRSCFS